MKRPAGVIVIAVLYWFGAAWLLLLGAVLAIGATIFGAAMAGVPAIIGGLGLIGGIFLLAFGVALAFVGYGLFGLQEWARMTVVVLAVISIVFSVMGFIAPMGIAVGGRLIKLAIHAAILWYLIQPQVKARFQSRV